MEMAAVINSRSQFRPIVEPESVDSSGEEMDNRDGGNIISVDILPSGERVKRKAKRPSKLLAHNEASSANGQSAINGQQTRNVKNSRRPRTRYGRGLPKKGGAGGKGTWGKPGVEISVADTDIIGDIHDPNYDSDNQENCAFESIAPELTEDELEKVVDPILMEYFEHGDTEDVTLSLEELNISNLHPQLIMMAISLAMERKPSHREMTSALLSDLYGRIINQDDIAKGFDLLIKNLPDLVLDTPDATTVLGNFLARAVADDCLPPKYVHSYKGAVFSEHARAALEHADVLLNMKHGLVRLDNVWGIGGGMRPVKYLVKKIQLLLKEYLSSGDVEEATRCLLELEVPHFHHELVYEAVVMTIEDMGERAMDLICTLLKSLASSIVITPDQMKRGFERVYQELPDISIDVPGAYLIMEKFLPKCNSSGFLSSDIIRGMPSRGRKRFVSEGDGGIVKEISF